MAEGDKLKSFNIQMTIEDYVTNLNLIWEMVLLIRILAADFYKIYKEIT